MAASNTRFTQNSLGQSKNPIDSDHGIYRYSGANSSRSSAALRRRSRSLPAGGRSRFSKIVAVSLQARTRLDAMMMIVVTTRTMPWLILPGMIARTSLSRTSRMDRSIEAGEP